MLRSLLDWFGHEDRHGHDGDGLHHDQHHHAHGAVDPSIATTARGIWAIKWSFVILAMTAALQMVVVLVSSSIALLADTIHNIGDATTAVPLWIAFLLARRKPTATFTYGYGRFEDLAGILIVLIILFSALVAGYEAIDRFIHPQPIRQLLWVAVAGVIGFLGNEAVAMFRIRVGREIKSAALVADGYHARTDGLTSLAVVVGAGGIWLGFPLADPLVGLVITAVIFAIVWQSARVVLVRMLDGVEPGVVGEICHAAEHVPRIESISDIKARWLGHHLHAEAEIVVEETLTVREASLIAERLRAELFAHLPALAEARIRFRAPMQRADERHRASWKHVVDTT